jgi:tripartite-type tricarboxylate transporter receptor subunit TctC
MEETMLAMHRHRASAKIHLKALAAAALLVAATVGANAQADYPNRPIHIIVPLPPGATADTLPRIIGEKLTARWGQPVIIENRPGASQNLGAEAVFRSEPDGYALLATPQGPLTVSGSMFPRLGFDASAFVPVTVMAQLPYVLVANPKVPFATLPEMIAYAKANPDKLNYGSPGSGSSTHLSMEWLKTLAGIQFTHVPYKGAAPALTDLLAGHIEMMFDNLGNPLQFIRDGKLRALAVASESRIAELPDVPAIAETFPGFVSTSWFAIVAPPRTPPEIAAKLQAAIAEILAMPDVAEKLRQLPAKPVGSTPAETAALIREETERWRKIVTQAGIKPE